MPTGYTSVLYDGKEQTFVEFVMQCARAFGACIEMRDDPWDKPIPDEFPHDDYHDRQLVDARKELKEAKRITLAEAEKQAAEAYDAAVKSHREEDNRRNAIRERYTNMLDQVNRWAPPTPEHKGLKEFMIQQLTDSIDWDCKTYSTFPKKESGREWLAEHLEQCKRSVEYHEKESQKERQRTEERNRWIRELRRSLATCGRE